MTETSSPTPVVQPPQITWADPGDTPDDLRAQTCPNCGSTAPKTMALTIELKAPDNLFKRLRLLACPDCTCHFYDSQLPPDYAAPAMINRGRVPFYVQQGAGVSLITRPLARVQRPPGSAYMEVGCGYGFGLDYALNTRGWVGKGIDPAALSELGRDALNLPIELRYLRDDDEARGTVDVVMGSEVIEHVPSPAAFIRTLRAMLKPGGTMILTTPNGADIHRSTAAGIIVPLLSPSLHLVIQNRESLSALLNQAGFAHVDVEIDSHSLVAYASDAPLALESRPDALRLALRDHLERRARAMDVSTDLFVAFASRAFYESVNDGDMAAADRAWALLVPGIRARFGLDIDAITSLPPALATCSLEQMAALVPLTLGGLLLARAIRRLAAGTPRGALEAQFLLAAEAADAMRRALGELAMEDGQTEDIGWTARAEALLCAAESGPADLVARFAALPTAPNGGEPRRRVIALRALSNLANAGKLATGRTLAAGLSLHDLAAATPDAALTEAERDALYALAVLDSEIGPNGAPVGNPARGRDRFRRVRGVAPQGGGLWWNAVSGEAQALRLLNDPDGLTALAERVIAAEPTPRAAAWAVPVLVHAGRYPAARAIAEQHGLAPLGRSSATAEARDLTFALAVLDLQPGGDPKRAVALFQSVRKATGPGADLWRAAIGGELHALSLTGDDAAKADLAEAIAHDTTDPALARLALPSLVNAGRYAPARALAVRSGLAASPFAQPATDRAMTDEERDLVFFLAVIDVQTSGRSDSEPAVARARFQRVRRACPPGDGLWWAALRGELQALDQLDAQEEGQILLSQVEAENPALTLPDDLASRVRAI